VFQQVVHSLKYQGMKSLGIRLGKEIGNRIKASPTFSSADYILPIPLHKLKQRERGYNQSEYLCKGISETTGILIAASFLSRTKYTRSQTQLNLEERRENVGEAFRTNQKFLNEIRGKSFILVDDVITTGSTITACARELRANGAGIILAASAALAQRLVVDTN
jgi:ComF family protein